MVITRKKLIETALPLDAVNAESAREKSIRHGHPSTLHIWWARRPLAAARAVIFAQLVDDPAAVPEEFPTPEAQEAERQRLFRLLEQLVRWENSTNEALLAEARAEIRRGWLRACADNAGQPEAARLFDPDRPPPFADPFAGGGALPLEAQRLGLEAHAGDLNPVAVLINKAMVEIPPRFAGRPPVNPASRAGRGSTGAAWKGAAGLAEDVRHYGRWMRDEAERRIGRLYPKVTVTPSLVAERPDLARYRGRELTVIAWLWARTVPSPNPVFAHVEVPLASSFVLSAKPGKEAYVEPAVEGSSYRFRVRAGKPADPAAAARGTKAGRGSNFTCLLSGTPISDEYIKAQGRAGRMGARLLAIVAEGDRERVYLPPLAEHEEAARTAPPAWKPDVRLADDPRALWTVAYGLETFGDLFTPRQLAALTTFSDLVGEAMERVRADALAAGLPDDPAPLCDGGAGARAYAEAVAVYLALAVDRLADGGSTLARWRSVGDKVDNTFSRQALPMMWDFAEANPFSTSSRNFEDGIGWVAKSLAALPACPPGAAAMLDAAAPTALTRPSVIATDPPYFDNIGYADLSDFFYTWLRRSLRPVYPDLFATVATPKAQELIAAPARHGSRAAAEQFFLAGMARALANLAAAAHPAYPLTIFYAYKQEERGGGGPAASTGWETFLEALIAAGFAVTGTWPMRTERTARSNSLGANALASSIAVVCRPRAADAPAATRAEFIEGLREALRDALPVLISGQVAPVDLAQAAIGPGMAVYSRYAAVLRQDGSRVTVREALQEINAAIGAYRAERTAAFDPKTRFCIEFYDQFGFGQAEYDAAVLLARAQNVGVDALVSNHLLGAERGKAWLEPPASYPSGAGGLAARPFGGSAWEACLRLAVTLREEGEAEAGALARALGEGNAARARELAVWLYTYANARRRAEDALLFNALDVSWPEIQRRAAASADESQRRLI